MVGLQQTYQHFDLIVIGSGVAGSHAALLAVQRGLRVAIVEDGPVGGDSLNYSDLPLKFLSEAARHYHQARAEAPLFELRTSLTSFNYGNLLAKLKQAVAQVSKVSRHAYQSNNIQLLTGRAYFLTPQRISINNQHYQADHFLIAAGANWQIPTTPGINNIAFYTPRTILQLENLPDSLFIVGGHRVAVELAQTMAMLGVKVYLTHRTTDLLPEFNSDINQQLEHDLHHKFGITISTNSQVLEYQPAGSLINIKFSHAGIERELAVEAVLIAEQLQPETDLGLTNACVDYSTQGIITNQHLLTSNRHILAAGDVLNTATDAATAIVEAETAIYNLTHRQKRVINYQQIPQIITTYPAIAKVGLTEANCRQQRLACQAASTTWEETPRQLLPPYYQGGLKLISHRQQLIGAEIYGPQAEAIIHQLAIAIQQKLTIRQLLAMPQAFLTWEEIINITANKLLSTR